MIIQKLTFFLDENWPVTARCLPIAKSTTVSTILKQSFKP